MRLHRATTCDSARRVRAAGRLALFTLLLAAAAAHARQQIPAPLQLELRTWPRGLGALQDRVEPPLSSITAQEVALFAAGAATGFAAHESCHLLTNLLLGGTPRLERVTFLGFIPFFAISPGLSCSSGRCTRFGEPFGAGTRGVYAIVSAGFQCQHIEDEVILTDAPKLREQEAPFRKGMLAFNTLTSVGYVLANWLALEPPQGDIATVTRLTPAPRGVVTGLLLATASLDLARYFAPDEKWLAWVSRVTKVAMGGLVLTF